MDRLWRGLRKGMGPAALVLLGILVAAFLWIRALDSRPKALRASAGAAPPPGAVAATAPASSERRAVPGDVTPGWGEDPFARRFSTPGDQGAAHPARKEGPKERTAKPTGLYLQGVMTGPLGRTALINGSVVREGERIGTREVLQIGRRSVVLLDNGNVVTLSLQGEGR